MYHAIEEQFSTPNGHQDRWEKAFEEVPNVRASVCTLNTDTVTVGKDTDISSHDQAHLLEILRGFHPWRKGPFSFFDLFIDTEWRSDWKWSRLSSHIAPLEGKKVLDVGCGSGYHCWRMYGAGASFVLGIDPFQIFWMQFRITKKIIKNAHSTICPVFYAPIPMDAFPINTQFFDTVFSMGVLYHRKDPFSHLERLRHALKKGGELVLETLITDGPLHHCFVPEDRYAQMRNVWFIPSVETLLFWLRRCGFRNIRVVDINKTSIEEQRSTDFMTFQSLVDFLDPDDHSKTIEGHPAPKRVIILANR
jgi:tRNA (mo5U34)-methyltransferase